MLTSDITKLKNILKYPEISCLRRLAIVSKCQIYLVGGSLRDLISERNITDFDLTVKGDILTLSKNLANMLKASHVLLDKKRKTVRIITKTKFIIDFTFLAKSLIYELKRRDFTVNSLAFDLINLDFLDPLSGLTDLKNKTIKMNSDKVFKADPVRLLRAVRLKADLGFKIEAKTLKQIKKDKKLILKIKSERITEEFFKILANSNSRINLQLLDDLSLNSIIFEIRNKEKKAPLSIYKRLENCFKKNIINKKVCSYYDDVLAANRNRWVLLKLAALILDKKIKISRAFKVLKLSLKEKKTLEKILKYYYLFCDKINQYSFLNQTEPVFLDLVILSLASNRISKTRADKLFSMYFSYQKRKLQFKKIIDGDILKNKLKIKSSPLIGFILDKLQEAYYLKEIKTQAEALRLVRKLIQKRH